MSSVYRSAPRDLGERRARYASRLQVHIYLLLVVTFLVPGATLVGNPSRWGDVFAGRPGNNPLVGAILLVVFAGAAWSVVTKATLRIDEHERGLRWRERGRSSDVLWTDIVEVRATRGRATVYHLQLEDGRVLMMTEMLRNVHDLADRIGSHRKRRGVET